VTDLEAALAKALAENAAKDRRIARLRQVRDLAVLGYSASSEPASASRRCRAVFTFVARHANETI
jgi:hypothetical protein